jgi:hypothetical protein
MAGIRIISCHIAVVPCQDQLPSMIYLYEVFLNIKKKSAMPTRISAFINMKKRIYIAIMLLSSISNAQQAYSPHIADTAILQSHHVHYIMHWSIEKLFHPNMSNRCFKVVSISDYLWEITLDSLYFTFEHDAGEDLLKAYQVYGKLLPEFKQDLSKIIPDIEINYNVDVRYLPLKEQVLPDSASKFHMVHMRFSNLYIQKDEISILCKTRSKLLHLDQYWEDTFRIYVTLCPSGELICRKIDSLTALQYGGWPCHEIEEIYDEEGCMSRYLEKYFKRDKN